MSRAANRKPVVAIIAAGSMGAAVGARLVARGATVLTSLDARSAATCERAHAAGMTGASDEELVRADFVLSIVPPAAALPLAERLAVSIARLEARPVYVDCNAVSPATVERIAERIAEAGAPFVDAGIIGPPPRDGTAEPNFYASGRDAARFKALTEYGLEVRVLDGAIGAASALKMCYAGITKGLVAVGSAMLLAATRAGVADALRAELEESQRGLIGSLRRSVPGMFPKAYRWVAEMQEIAAFAGEDAAAAEIYRGAAELYARLARDVAGEGAETGQLESFLGPR
jgi:3-hydroxyisobutyrate dehydrogenase-like beta-hydroxyacid dehydrogenase